MIGSMIALELDLGDVFTVCAVQLKVADDSYPEVWRIKAIEEGGSDNLFKILVREHLSPIFPAFPCVFTAFQCVKRCTSTGHRRPCRDGRRRCVERTRCAPPEPQLSMPRLGVLYELR